MTTQVHEAELESVDGEEEEAPPVKAFPKFEAPDEFETVGSNVLGYYDPVETGAATFIITGLRLLDNSADSVKSSALILAELVKPATLIANSPNKDEQKPKEFSEGTGFGIWAKAGMRELINLQGATVWMAPAGYQKMKEDGKKKNPMLLFTIKRLKSSAKGERIRLLEDARKDSLTEAATAKNPPWHLLAVGDDYGVPKAKETLLKRLAGNN